MYQAWQWGGTPGATAQPAAAGQVGATAQWPAGYNYAAMTPEMQQQWAAAWASQAYAYSGAVPVAGQAANTAVPYPAAYPAEAPTANSNNVQPSSNEQPKNPTESAPTADKAELDKLKQLKEQAEQWKTLQQPAAAAWNYTTAGVSGSAPPATPGDSLSTSGATAPNTQPDQAQLDKEEEEFEKQFKDWEKQFDAWKEQNANHPDKEAFAQYEKQWQEWRAQLLTKKEDMQKAKAERAAAAAAAATNTAVTANAEAAMDPNAALYYQQAQYMYMQNYMYQGGMPGVPPAGGAQPGYPYGAEGYPQGDGNGQDMQPPNPNGPNPKDMNNFDQDQYGQGEQFPPQGDYQNYDEYGNMYPPDMDPEQYNREMNFGRGRGPRGRGARGRGRGRGRGGRWNDPNDEGMPPDMRPGLLNNPGDFPPEDFHDGPGNFGRGPLRDYPDGPGGPHDNQGPPFDPDESPRKRRNNDRFSGPPGKAPHLSRDDPLLPPRKMNEGPPPQPSNRYPPDDFEEEFPEPPFDEPPFEEDFPPMSDFGGRPPFHDDFGPPPFENRFPPRRGGRFGPRGRFGGPPHDFDRFGGPPFPEDGPPFGPPGDRFPFPDGPRGRGPRHFGPGGHFPEEPFFRGGGPMRFKSKDYTHRSAEDFDPHYDFENEFNEDVMQFRDNFSTELSGVTESIIFSQVSVQTYDYGHGLEPMTSSITAATVKDPEFPTPKKVFNYGHRGGIEDTEYLDQERFPPFSGDRNRERDYDKFRSRDFDDRNQDFRGRDFEDRDNRDIRSRYFGNREPKDIGDRDSKDFRGRDAKDYRDQDSKDFRDRDSKDFRGRDPKEFIEPDSKERESLSKDLRSRYFANRDSKDSVSRDSKDSREPPGKESRDLGGRDFRDHVDRDLDLRDSKRGRDRYRDDAESREKRSRWDPTDESDRNGSRDQPVKKESFDKKASDVSVPHKSQSRPFKSDEATLIDDLLLPPNRENRPKQIVIILCGLPGSGKTHVAKLIKDKEIESGGSAPRILSLDDYFMAEQEVNDIDPDTGKKVKRKEFKYEYEAEMEETYRSSLFKSFKKTIDDRFFPFIIVDAINNKTKHYEQYWSYAKPRGFEVYIAELDSQDPSICFKRNIHDRTLEDITKLLITWESKPKHFMALDVRSLLQEAAITEVEMEVETDDKKDVEEIDLGSPGNDADEEVSAHVPSRWEKFEATEEKLLQLDGLRVKKSSSMEDYLQLPDDYENRKCEPGKKRVRWADLEERKEQDRLRAIGFVVGQTDWNKMTDPSHADRALTKTKFF